MRDSNRIDSFCKKLAQYWKDVPDWRFGQLISNVYGASGIRDPFFAEEDETLELFEKFFDKPKDVLVILMGKSGSGKSSVGQELVDRGYRKIITTTTRPPRYGEVNAKDYTFVDDETFEKFKANGYFVETREYETTEGVWKYGSAVKSFENVTNKEVVILTPDAIPDVVPILRKNNKAYVVVYLKADDNVLRKRLYERGDASEEIERRLKADDYDFMKAGVWSDFNIPVDGKTVEQITDTICGIVDKKMGLNNN